MTEPALVGQCLCGSIGFEVAPPYPKFVYCHCSRCRKATGSAYAANLYVEPAQLRWTSGEDQIQRFRLDSARSFGKWFCKRCGASLPRLTRSARTVVVPAGALDSAPPCKPTAHIFWGSRASWTVVGDRLPKHDEYPPDW